MLSKCPLLDPGGSQRRPGIGIIDRAYMEYSEAYVRVVQYRVRYQKRRGQSSFSDTLMLNYEKLENSKLELDFPGH